MKQQLCHNNIISWIFIFRAVSYSNKAMKKAKSNLEANMCKEGVLFVVKNGNSGEKGGRGSCKIPLVVGVWIFSGITHCIYLMK